MTLWEEAGGEEGVRRIIQRLYDLLFEDPMVSFLFAGKNKAVLVEHQLWFTARFLDGPQDRYTGRPLPEAHHALPLLSGHFDRRHHLLKQVLAEQGISSRVTEEWLRIDQTLKTAILKSGEEARERARTSG